MSLQRFGDAGFSKHRRPPPEILTVGIVHFPPYQVINEDGSFTGLAVEALRDLAARAHLDLQMVPISNDAFRAGPGEGGYDMLPQAGISDERRNRFEFTRPIETEWVSMFVLRGRAAGRAGLDDFRGRAIGVASANIGQRIAEAEDGIDTVVYEDQPALLQGLLRRDVDAVLVTESSFWRAIDTQGVAERIERLRPPVHETERAVALRRGLGVVRERLNAVLPAYLASADYRAHRDRWLGDEISIWADRRVRLVILTAVGALIAFAGLFVYSAFRRRHQIVRERRRYAAEIAEHIPIGLLIISPEGQIDFANREIREKTPDGKETLVEGHSYRSAIKSLIDRGLVDTQGRDPGDMLKVMTEDGLADGYSEEFRLADGSGVFLRTTKRLKSGSALIVRQDITDYRRQVQQIEALNDDLEEQIRHAEVANQELRAFAYATSHDLKAPTNTLMMSLEALAENLESKLEADDAELIDVAKRTVDSMRTLIDDILTYTNTIGSTPECEPVDLNKVASDVIEALRADIEVNAAEIKLAPLPRLKASPTQMHQLVQNLISNAVKFHRPDQAPAIDIEATEAPPGYVAFKVRDNGIGIAPEQQSKVFELFARLNRRGDYAGTGLGLAICQRIVLNHGGRIDLQSTPGDGSCFTVLLEEETNDPPSHAS
ncbi:MAG: ATP-binding protein [Pseudomonadota bacterium]